MVILMLNFDDCLFVTEVGSRMWGMADETSDYDLFCCYNTPAKEYLRTGEFEKTKPHKNFIEDGKEYDIQYMEIGHLVKLLMKGNVNTSDKVCQWKENDEYGYWETGCKGIFEFIEGDIEDNTFKFCPYCGGKIKELRQEREQ
jgi:hypothetical protein